MAKSFWPIFYYRASISFGTGLVKHSNFQNYYFISLFSISFHFTFFFELIKKMLGTKKLVTFYIQINQLSQKKSRTKIVAIVTFF